MLSHLINNRFVTFLKSAVSKKKSPLVTYDSFEKAVKGCTTYDDNDIADLVVKKTASLIKSIVLDRQCVQNLYVVSLISRRVSSQPVNVIDWGGAAGATFFQLVDEFDAIIDRWTVLETPSMVAKASVLQHGKLNFTSQLTASDLDRNLTNVLWAQGVLNFLPTPLKNLVDLMKDQFQFVYVSRTIVSNNAVEFFIKFNAPLENHGPSSNIKARQKMTSYPLCVINKVQLFDAMKSVGLSPIAYMHEGIEEIGSTKYPVIGVLFHKL
jgi:putative methyltransferase (TIGR04325 family)